MDPQIIVLLITMAGTIFLFSVEWFPVEVTGLGLVVFLVLTGLLTPEEAFAGFGS
ncbi:MAG: hypothetical protein GX484_07545 [Chloroflexi bacterium]|nr:hypothetical protein [Chloroflexota bacterium]